MTKLKCSDFAKHVLNTPLWPKQEEILDEYFGGGKSHACWALGRRSGKTLMASIAAVYACFVLESSYKRKVRKNEKWYIVTIANDQQQAKIALNNIRQLVLDSPLGTEITRETATEIEISNGCVFQAIPASARASRGKAVVMCVFDELAFSLEGDANRGAKAIYDALSPSIAQFGDNGRILELSSPWLTDGLFYEHFKEAESGQFPFMQAKNIPTWEINPNLPWGCPFLDAEQKRDEDKFWTEYGARFRGNKSSLLAAEIVEAAINRERGILLPDRQIMGKYVLALDPARGGVGRDEYVSCIQAVEDWIREHHKIYQFDSIVLDQFNSSATIQSLSGDFPIRELTWSVSTKMKAFSKMKELFNAGLVDIYPHERAIRQLKNLNVLYRQSGQWSVTGGKEVGVDDFCFALAAAMLEASKEDDLHWLESLVR